VLPGYGLYGLPRAGRRKGNGTGSGTPIGSEAAVRDIRRAGPPGGTGVARKVLRRQEEDVATGLDVLAPLDPLDPRRFG